MELFTLSKHIAACAFDMTNLKSKEECTAVGDENFGHSSSFILYTDSNTNCVVKDSDLEGICYTNGTTGFNTFNS